MHGKMYLTASMLQKLATALSSSRRIDGMSQMVEIKSKTELEIFCEGEEEEKAIEELSNAFKTQLGE